MNCQTPCIDVSLRRVTVCETGVRIMLERSPTYRMFRTGRRTLQKASMPYAMMAFTGAGNAGKS